MNIKSWDEDDRANIADVRYARQNGVPLVVRDSAGRSVPGDLVNDWGAGNWSGTARRQLRAPRAGACIAHHNGSRYLIYGYFSSATPSAMARVYQAYDCDYAIMLDMNSAGQCYIGMFSDTGNNNFIVEHPVKEMARRDSTIQIDQKTAIMPRYVGIPDQGDFYYILRR